MEYLSVIQGDTLDAVITIEKPEELEISSVHFVCASLGLDEELLLSDTEEPLEPAYSFMLAPEVTQSLGVGNWNFDIIVNLDGGEVYTVLRGLFEVIYRKNA